jgi:hypothetical protein
MRDIIFLFGAGASYGAGGILPEPPPLGFQLYSILERVCPSTWGGLPNTVKNVFYEDFERGMQIVYARFSSVIPALMRDMAIYFIQFRPYRRSTLYCRLTSDLQRSGLLPRVLFSTLNYDCVLEYSLLEQKLSISYFDEGNSEIIPVWKLHGSCNMFSHSVQVSQGVYYGTGVVWEGGIQAFLDSNSVIQHCLVETGLAPVMCLYMHGKLLNVSPAAVRQLQQEWVKTVIDGTAIVCIGVRPLPEDTHIWDHLATSPAPLYFIGDQQALDAWQQISRVGSTEYLGPRFNTAYQSLIERLNTYATK